MKAYALMLLVAALLLAVSCGDNPDDSGKDNPPINSSLCAGFADGTTREHYGKGKPQFCDTRDGQKYVYTEIGGQTWMAENLNYHAENSRCYNDNPDNCTIYGRLYDWAETMALPNVCNSCYKPELCEYSQSLCEWLNSQIPLDEYCENNTCQVNEPHQGICPDGWHVPNNADWDKLFRFVDSENDGNGRETKEYYQSDTAGKYLKAVGYWSPGDSTENLDTYGFSALPGGLSTYGDFGNVGIYGFWWSATETSASMSNVNMMFNNNSDAYWFTAKKTDMYSVRCVKND